MTNVIVHYLYTYSNWILVGCVIVFMGVLVYSAVKQRQKRSMYVREVNKFHEQAVEFQDLVGRFINEL